MRQSAFTMYVFFILAVPLFGQKTIQNQPFAHTFSIVAIDETSGDIGVAVQSHWFSVGSLVSWAEPGVGAVATQSLVNPSFGPHGLELLKQGKSPEEALKLMLEGDEGRAFRQVAIIDHLGRVAVHTGDKCIEKAGHISGNGFSVQANMMLNESIWPAMSVAFEKSAGLPLAERMFAALEAAQKAGGDIRGQQSAALLVVKGKSTGKIWEDRKMDLRVEDHPSAVAEMGRLLKVSRAYEHMNNGDLAIEHNQMDRALKEYGAAQEMFPDNLEMKYWTAVSLVNIQKVPQAIPLFKEVFLKDGNWKELTSRIFKNGMLTTDQNTLDEIMRLP